MCALAVTTRCRFDTIPLETSEPTITIAVNVTITLALREVISRDVY